MAQDINQLHYISHIENIPSILKLGILSHGIIDKQKIKFLSFFKKVKFTPIYDEEIILIRKNRKTPDNKSLWEYVNLYFQPRNPMLYRVVCEQSAENIAVLGVDFDVIKLADAFVTDGNAASISSYIVPAKEHKEVINPLKKVLNGEWWTDDDQIDSKRKIMAECLVPEKIEPGYIKAIYVADDSIAAEVKKKIFIKIPVIPEPHLFFKNPIIVKLTSNLSVFKGDMFFSRMHTLTISVNIVGIMGKGLASRAKYQFPRVYVDYQDLCRRKILKMGSPYLYKRETSLDIQLADESRFPLKNGNGETWFLLFPTKSHWRERADFNQIEKGMQWVKENYKKEGIKSLAIPALGCGLGNLNWKDVGPMLCKYLVSFDIPVQLYLPAEKQIPEQYLKKEFLLSLI
jgi:hypothetical protein